jgi:putative hemin transport protein
MVLSVPPRTVFNRLTQRGSLRFSTGNAAVQVAMSSALRGVVHEGQRAILDGGVELWLFEQHWRSTPVVAESTDVHGPLTFQFRHGSGDRLLEVTVDPRQDPSLRAALARWRATAWKDPRGAVRGASRPERVPAWSPGAEMALARARKHGEVAVMRELVMRHGLSRLEVLSLIGEPWAHRIRPFGVKPLLQQIEARRLRIQLLIGNEGLTFVRTGCLSSVAGDGCNVVVREEGLEIRVRVPLIESLWAVRLNSDRREISSLEAYDTAGEPAFLLFGDRPDGQPGVEAATWRSFVDRHRLGRGARGGVGIREVAREPDPRAEGAGGSSIRRAGIGA